MSTFPEHFRVMYHLYFKSDKLDQTAHINTNLMAAHLSNKKIGKYVKETTVSVQDALNSSCGTDDFRPMTDIEIQMLVKPMQPDYGEVDDGKHPCFRH